MGVKFSVVELTSSTYQRQMSPSRCGMFPCMAWCEVNSLIVASWVIEIILVYAVGRTPCTEFQPGDYSCSSSGKTKECTCVMRSPGSVCPWAGLHLNTVRWLLAQTIGKMQSVERLYQQHKSYLTPFNPVYRVVHKDAQSLLHQPWVTASCGF